MLFSKQYHISGEQGSLYPADHPQKNLVTDQNIWGRDPYVTSSLCLVGDPYVTNRCGVVVMDPCVMTLVAFVSDPYVTFIGSLVIDPHVMTLSLAVSDPYVTFCTDLFHRDGVSLFIWSWF